MADFGYHRGITTAAVVERAARSLDRLGLEVVAKYGATGNLALRGKSRKGIAQVLKQSSELEWAVLEADEVLGALNALDRWPPPPAPAGMKLTSGLVVAVEPVEGVEVKDRRDRPLAYFRAYSARVVLANKLDCILANGKLDSHRRRGGWGAVSGALKCAGTNRWTARSALPVRRLGVRAGVR